MRALAPLLVMAGCMWQSADPPPLAASHVESFEWPGYLPPKMDVLFVVDDTAAMAPYVDRTAAMLRAIDGLWPGIQLYAQPDLHVAVATGAGELHGAPSVHGPFVDDEHKHDLSGDRVRNFDGSLGDAVAALGAVGTGGSLTGPLDAMRVALQNNPDFLRSNAYLAIVIVNASDDASAVDPASLATWVKGLESDPDAVLVGGVFPASATRLADFVAQFPSRGETVSIDASDYTPAISQLPLLYKVILGVPCLAEPMDVDAATAGPQYDCAIELVGEDGSTELEPACGDANVGSRCWTYRPDPMNCIDPIGGRVEVAPFTFPVMPTLRGQCVVAN